MYKQVTALHGKNTSWQSECAGLFWLLTEL